MFQSWQISFLLCTQTKPWLRLSKSRHFYVSLPGPNMSAHIYQLNHIQHVLNASMMTSYTEPLKMSDNWAYLTGSQSISVAVNTWKHDICFHNDPSVINTVNISPMTNSATKYTYQERKNLIKSTKALSQSPHVHLQPMSEDNFSYTTRVDKYSEG